MRTTTCLFSTAAALQRVFITPLEHRSTQHLRRLPTSIPLRNAPSLLQRRNVATAAPADKRRAPRDDEIPSEYIILINPDNSLSAPQPLTTVMRNLDRTAYTLMQMQPASSPSEPALCKLVDKKKQYADQKLKAKNAKKSAAAPTKNLELNWAIEEGDLEHRVRRLKEFLERGMKVEVAIAAKRRGKKASVEEAEGLLVRLRKAVEEVEGARESKEMEGEVGKDVKFFVEGTVKKEVKEGKKKKGVELKGDVQPAGLAAAAP